MNILRRIAFFFLLIACTCILTGCLKNDVLDREMNELVTALNQGDSQLFLECFYPIEINEEAADAKFQEIKTLWEKVDPASMKLTSFSMKTESINGTRIKSHTGVYEFTMRNLPWRLELLHWQSEDASGLARFNISQIPESTLSVSVHGIITAACSMVHILCFVLVIIDVIRKKRRKPVLLILLGLVYFRLRVNEFSFLLPLGAIIYFLIRKKLKSKETLSDPSEIASPVENTDTETPVSTEEEQK